MNKSDLINALARKQTHLTKKEVERTVDCMIDAMTKALLAKDRIEIRGFGCFSLRYYASRQGRNPFTGKTIPLPAKHLPHFKPGKELLQRVNAAKQAETLG